MQTNSIIYTDNGIIRFYDGTIVAVEQVLYSPDGVSNWEESFIPYSHPSTIVGDPEKGSRIIEAHKYRKYKHAINRAGTIVTDQEFQPAHKFVSDDGDYTEMRLYNDMIQYKLSKSEVWIDLISIDLLKGDKGDKGEIGEGFQISSYKAFDRFGSCSDNTVSSCNSCSGTQTHVNTLVCSLGNHQLDGNDIGKFFEISLNSGLTECTSDNLGTFVYRWGANDVTDSLTTSVTCNAQGQVLLFNTCVPFNSTGYCFICVNNYWTKFLNVTEPLGLIKVDAGDTLGYLEDKVDNVTIGINVDKELELKENSVEDVHLKTNSVTPIKIDPSIAGLGLSKSLVDYKLNVEVDDLTVNITNNELSVKTEGVKGVHINTSTPNPVFNIIKGFDVSSIDTTGAEVLLNPADALTVDADGIKIKDTGVQGKHLNVNTANNAKGIEVLDQKLNVKVDGTTIGFDGSGKLKTIASTNEGDLKSGNTLLTIANGADKVISDVTFTVNVANILHDDLKDVNISTEHDGRYIQKSVLTAKGDILVGGTNVEPSTIPIGANDQVLVCDNSTPSGLKWHTLPGSSTILPATTTPVNVSLSSSAKGIETTKFALEDHTHYLPDLPISKITGLQDALDTKFDNADTLLFGNIKLVPGSGLFISYGDPLTWFKLVVIDSNGNLDTVKQQ